MGRGGDETREGGNEEESRTSAAGKRAARRLGKRARGGVVGGIPTRVGGWRTRCGTARGRSGRVPGIAGRVRRRAARSTGTFTRARRRQAEGRRRQDFPRETARSSGRCERAPRHDDDLARVRWRERETRHASKGVARAANVPPDRRGAPGRVAILRATRRGARDRRGWSRASRAPHKRTAPRRGSRGARFRATRASPPRPVPRAKTSSCSRKGSSYVTRSVGRGARGIARGALRGSAAHAGPRSLSTAHQDARLGSREIFRSVVGPSSRFEPRRARTTHRPSNGPGVFLRGKRSRAVSRPVFFRHSQRHLVARAHLSIRNHPTPHARGSPPS